MKQKILVTGCNGFLATTFAKLFRDKFILYGFYNKTLTPSAQELYVKTFSQEELGNNKVSFDIILHLASYIPYGKMNEGHKALLNSNILLTLKLIERFPNSLFIYSSSVSIYGTPTTLIDEKSAILQPNLYGQTKLVGECLMNFIDNFRIIRFSSLYGVGMKNHSLIPRMIHQAKTSSKITIWGDGSRKQDYFHVEDACHLLYKTILYSSNGIFLGVLGKSYSNLEIAKIIQKYIPETKISFTNNKDDSPSFIYNNEYTIKTLNFERKVSIESGIKELT